MANSSFENAPLNNEDRFANAFEHAAIGMALAGLDGSYFQVNKPFCEFTGYSKEELEKMSFMQITFPEDLEKDRSHVKKILSGEIKSFIIEKRYIHKSGVTIWGLLSVSLIRDKNGDPLYFISQIQDINERKKAFNDLEQRNKELSLLNKLSEKIISLESLKSFCKEFLDEISASLNFPIVAIERYDKQRELMIFECVKGIDDFASNGIFEVSINETLSGVVAKSGQPLFEYDAFQKPEYNNPTLRNLGVQTFLCFPLKEGNSVIATLSLAHTEKREALSKNVIEWLESIANYIALVLSRKKAVDALIYSENKYRSLFDYANDAIYIICPMTNKILECNKRAAAMDEYSIDELQKMLVEELHPENERPFLPGKFKEVLEKGRATGISGLHHLSGTGKLVPIEVNATMIDVGGTRLNLSIVRDISDRKKWENELLKAKESAEEANIFKDKFINLVVHDIRNPVVSIKGLLSILLGNEKEPFTEWQRNLLNSILGSTNQMNLLINELISLSSLTSGSFKPRYRFVSVGSVVEKVISGFDFMAKSKEISLKNEIDENTKIYTDETLLFQVMSNLVSNAVKFCRAHDNIRIFIPKGENSTVAVEDTGVGIKPELFNDLFDIDKLTTTPGTSGEKGTGMGLPLCYFIMNALGGKLEVTSTPDKGTLFLVKLNDIKPKILIVDDELLFRMEQRIYLREITADIIEAENGSEALELAIKERPHLIITDINMPVMGGLQFIEELKKHKHLAYIPVIAVTGLQGRDIKNDAFKAGAADFVQKPFEPDELFPRVRRFLY